MPFEKFPEDYLKQLKSKYRDRRQTEFEHEKDQVVSYFQSVRERLDDNYLIDEIMAVGGSGIVHRGHHKRFEQPIVLKINRPNILPGAVSMVENEATVLPALSHPNIVRVLDLGEITDYKPKLTYVVEPFITGSKAFFTADKDRVDETWLYERIESLKEQMPDVLQLGHGDAGRSIGLVTALLVDVAALFSQWVSLLMALGDKGYVYLDVKAENVLVDQHLHLVSIDYGSVEKFDPAEHKSIEVFFTDRYAHPDLLKRKLEKASSNRVRGGIKRSELRYAFDYFALGMSMLEILNAISAIRPHVVPQLPLYRSLHFLATRLLDGRNSNRVADDHYEYASQVFPSLQEADYPNLAYTTLTDTYRDLEKEQGRWNLETEVPELATYSKDIVRLVPGFNTVLTPRLRGVIEHPLVARLKYVTQLGLVSLVYPTADHSRYDHALGAYTYTTYYVKSLFNDLGNPLFRNLVGAEDLNAVLLAALLHDLGQYPLAHDLEEVHDRIFKHGRIGMDFLEDSEADQYGRTLQAIIEDPNNGWGVNTDSLRRILGAHSKNLELVAEEVKATLKTNVLAAIVDGQIDADKADYIIRDSVRCELPYGSRLDLERLLRVLTVAIIPEEISPERRVALGVYDKGLVSAHAFGQARYQLLSTVYWHHTARIIKSMLQYATASGLPRLVFGAKSPERDALENQIHEHLLQFLKKLIPPFDFCENDFKLSVQTQAAAKTDLAAEPPAVVISTLSDEAQNESEPSGLSTDWYPGISWTDWLMLEWICGLPDSSIKSNNLIHAIRTRQLYKRVATFNRGGPHDDLIRRLDDLPWPDRVDLCADLHDKVYQRLSADWANINTATTLTQTDFDQLCDSHLLMLIDIPSSSRKIGYDRPLGVVPELKEKSYHQGTRHAAEDKSWRDVMNRMIEGIAPVRVLCHPDVRNLVSAIYAPVEASLAKLIGDLL